VTNGSNAYRLEVRPIVLKELIVRCDIFQGNLATHLGLARTTINLVINRGYLPATVPDFKSKVEQWLMQQPGVEQWLIQQGFRIGDIWSPLGRQMHRVHPKSSYQTKKDGATSPGNPESITIQWEVEMISQEAMRHFKLFRNPFIDDIQKDSDIYMSDEHRFIKEAMLDAARHGGFLAIIGEVGSGKSVMRRMVVEQLKREGDMLVIYPQTIDKTRLTAASICDAIIYDISSEKAKIKLEDKSRQVQRLLLDRAKSGYRACLVIEEAHDLNVKTLKFLKRFYELEDGYRKLLGIILVGQTELKHLFNEAQNVDMREVIRRVQVAEIQGLNGHMRDYLATKFKRIGAKIEDIFSEDSFDALSRRLTSASRDGKGNVSHAYPLLVNNYAAKAMNLAFEMGEMKVSEEVIMAI